MKEKKPQEHNSEGRYSRTPSCEVYNLFGGVPCAKAGKVSVDGLVLCERHALEVKLEGQVECWDEMLFHIDLWSREAARQNRTQIVELLDVERAKAIFAIERTYEDLVLVRSESSRGEAISGGGELFRRGSLLPRGGRLLSRGLRHR
jgi:hypothetical protein